MDLVQAETKPIGESYMARFYGEIEGRARTKATRIGYKRIDAHIRGWDVRIYIEGGINADGKDEFKVYITKGSNDPRRKLIGIYTA